MDSSIDRSWSFLRTFSSQRIGLERAWRATAKWAGVASELVGVQVERLAEQVGLWSARLVHLGGDPCVTDWTTFRPLRLSREEDWSDWLAHLLQTSTTGRLARSLFGTAAARNLAAPTVNREKPTDDDSRRIDLLIEWRGASEITHLEVKIGDRNFAKTFDTSTKARAGFKPGIRWTNFILIPPWSLSAWLKVARQHQGEGAERILEFTWADVAFALRRCLLAVDENLSWQVWALSFCGAIEQTVLGHQNRSAEAATLFGLPTLLSQTEMMRRALTDE